jgi:hypothetical protein
MEHRGRYRSKTTTPKKKDHGENKKNKRGIRKNQKDPPTPTCPKIRIIHYTL